MLHSLRRSTVIMLTLVAMIAFAANTILARVALKSTDIDAATFTTVRLLSGALALWLIMSLRQGASATGGSWLSALALFAYASTYSYAYVSLPTGAGALQLFGAVQVTMIASGLRAGERLSPWQVVGLAMALGGLAYLMSPKMSALPLNGSVLMLAAGIAWGMYSINGRGAKDPTGATAGNFLRTVPLAIGLSLIALPWASMDALGAWYAVLSGALASGAGYAVWYGALRGLTATSAATVQLSVPVISATGGFIFLGEPVTLRLAFASSAILGGIALVILNRQRPA